MSDTPQESPAQQRLERIIFWISLVLVLAVAGTLVALDRTAGTAGPAIAGRVVSTRMIGDDLEVRYEVMNRGNRSVEDVTLKITLGESEEVSQTMAHLPKGVTREGVALFQKASKEARPTVMVEGYLEP